MIDTTEPAGSAPDQGRGEPAAATPTSPPPAPVGVPDRKPDQRQNVSYKGTGFAWSWLGWLILAVAILPVVMQNTQIVQVRYLIWDIRIPLAAAFLAVAVIAEVATEIIGWAWRARRRRELAVRAELKELKRQTASDA